MGLQDSLLLRTPAYGYLSFSRIHGSRMHPLVVVIWVILIVCIAIPDSV